MKNLLAFVFLICFGSMAFASWTVTSDGNSNCFTVSSTSNSCTAVRSALQTCLSAVASGYTATSCSADPVTSGTKVYWNSGTSMFWSVTGIANNTPTCTTGYHLDTATNTCVSDTPTVTCIPSPRTVSPCPSGYAPNQITIQTAEQSNIYTSSLDAMPTQELLYAIGVAICALMGVAVGVRLS